MAALEQDTDSLFSLRGPSHQCTAEIYTVDKMNNFLSFLIIKLASFSVYVKLFPLAKFFHHFQEMSCKNNRLGDENTNMVRKDGDLFSAHPEQRRKLLLMGLCCFPVNNAFKNTEVQR